MQTFGYVVAASAALVTANCARAHNPSTIFDSCDYSGATDIVVTDPEGRVVEKWRGELQPGAVVRLGPARLSPANALPWEYLRLRPDRTLSALYHRPPNTFDRFGQMAQTSAALPFVVWPAVPAVAETELRLVLFLRKDTIIPGTDVVWIPASARAEGEPDTRQFRAGSVRLSRNRRALSYFKNDFSTCVALVEGGRILAPLCDEFGDSCSEELIQVDGTLRDFKGEIMRRTTWLELANTPKQSAPVGSLRTLRDFVNLSVPTLTPP